MFYCDISAINPAWCSTVTSVPQTQHAILLWHQRHKPSMMFYCDISATNTAWYTIWYPFLTWLINAGLMLQSVFIRLSKSYCHCNCLCSSHQQLLNLPNPQQTDKTPAKHEVEHWDGAYCWSSTNKTNYATLRQHSPLLTCLPKVTVVYNTVSLVAI